MVKGFELHIYAEGEDLLSEPDQELVLRSLCYLHSKCLGYTSINCGDAHKRELKLT